MSLGSTYRIQLRQGVTFATAADVAPYLARLGVSHLYLSPIFAAAPGSTHGYDVTDCNVVDPTLGGEEGFDMLSDAAARHGLRLIVDFVPNHMAADPHNPWWRDVLTWGRDSRFAHHFDIDWSSAKLILPVLAKSYGDLLEEKAFGLEFEARTGEMHFVYGGLKLPLHPASLAEILGRIDLADFRRLGRALIETSAGTWPRRRGELARLCSTPEGRAALDDAMRATAEDPEALHALHERQAWRAVDWRAGREALNYRRFFEITGLVGLNVERDEVFRDVHAKALALVEAGKIHGLRLDHIDGLADPASYLKRLRAAVDERARAPFPLLVEKILGPGEQIRRAWPIEGTTGYEFANAATGLFVDRGAEPILTDAYRLLAGVRNDFGAIADACKRRIVFHNLASEFRKLTEMACAIAEADRRSRDLGPETLRSGIEEIAVALPVYRTYVDAAGAAPDDRATIRLAVASAREAGNVENDDVFPFLERTLLLDLPHLEDQAAALAFARRFQQTTGPVMAKAIEDTAFYRYNRLVALNEVGGDPDRFGEEPQSFHCAVLARRNSQPCGLNATATHDTKRGEDARARISAISEAPQQWAEHVRRWRDLNRGLRSVEGRAVWPDADMEWLFYQALLGAWPIEAEGTEPARLVALADRLAAFMLKAAREAKLRTNWATPQHDYEKALEIFVRGGLDPVRSGAFLADFNAAAEPLVVAGALNSLSQTLLKLTVPGVPDLYQGAEALDFSLVDPDNRRPVDFAALSRQARDVADATATDIMTAWRTAAPKLHVVMRALRLRREFPSLFAEGAYAPLEAAGPSSRNVVAYARVASDRAVIVIAPRLALGLLEGAALPLIGADRWRGTTVALPEALAGMRWRNALVDDAAPTGGGRIELAQALSAFPVGLLVSDSG